MPAEIEAPAVQSSSAEAPRATPRRRRRTCERAPSCRGGRVRRAVPNPALLGLLAVLALGLAACAEGQGGSSRDTGAVDSTTGDGGDLVLDGTTPDGAGDTGSLDATPDGDVAPDVIVPPAPVGTRLSSSGGGGTASSASHQLTMALGTPPFAVASSSTHKLLLGPVPR